ncbi:MAG: TonB-dependent receptor plug domain-containing protein, partial [Deltaproteobacteria bacterium]|nr:TonB-dependent receptor plug domain-containing protein [Deltaproteobacteria bacterium]
MLLLRAILFSVPGLCGLAGLSCAFVATVASAQDADAEDDFVYGADAVVERPIPASTDEDATAASTRVPVDVRAESLDDTGELLREVPGASPRSFGGLGSFQGLSLRGASLDQTEVLLGELPLGPAGGGAFDLSTIPLATLEAVEVYRGGAPLWLGASGIGGVLRLIPRSSVGVGSSQRLDVGSFGSRGARLMASAGNRDLSLVSVAGLRHTRGDYGYLDDGGTRLDASDDRRRRRQNGRVDEGYGLMHLRARALGGEVAALFTALGRTGGLTGSPVEEPTRARQTRLRVLGALSYAQEDGDAEGPGHRLALAASTQFSEDTFADALGEAGLGPRVTDNRSRRVFLRSAYELRGEKLSATALASASFEH